MLRWLVSNIRTILLALTLAVIVWISAVTSSDPDVTRAYPTPLPIEIVGQDPSLVISNKISDTVQVEIQAPQSVWDEILRTPNSVRAISDLTGLSAGKHDVPVQIQIGLRPARIISVDTSTLNLTLENLVTRTLNISAKVNGQPAVGYELADPVIDPAEVVVSGPQSLVDRVEKVIAVINASNIRQDIDTTVQLLAYDSENRTVSGISILPDSVHITNRVIQQGGYRDLAVKVMVTGQVASGYRLTNIVISPPVVTVYASDPALVIGLPGFVETEALNLDQAKENIETRLQLTLPAGISVVGDPAVLVQASITAIESSITISDKQIEIIGLDPQLIAEISPTSVDVIISGPLPVLEKLTANDVRVVLDLSGLAAGTHQVRPRMEILIQGLKEESINPSTVQVTLTPAGTSTPTPRP